LYWPPAVASIRPHLWQVLPVIPGSDRWKEIRNQRSQLCATAEYLARSGFPGLVMRPTARLVARPCNGSKAQSLASELSHANVNSTAGTSQLPRRDERMRLLDSPRQHSQTFSHCPDPYLAAHSRPYNVDDPERQGAPVALLPDPVHRRSDVDGLRGIEHECDEVQIASTKMGHAPCSLAGPWAATVQPSQGPLPHPACDRSEIACIHCGLPWSAA
jgi:hypothetical protein